MNTNTAGDLVTVPREPTREMMHAFLRAGPIPATPFRECYRAMLAASPAHATGAAMREGLEAYYARQIEWSRQTFGPALRTGGVIDHIRKELREIEAEPHDLSEWVDVIILAMDGYWRHGGTADNLMPALLAKQAKNMARTWPDWRTMSEHSAIEHDRSGEFLTSAKLDAMQGLTLTEIARHKIRHGRSAALSSPAQEGEAAPVRTDADGVGPQGMTMTEAEALIEDMRGTIHAYEERDRLAALKSEGETGPAVAVKPLEWRPHGMPGKTARTPFGDYRIDEEFWLGCIWLGREKFDTLEEAKAAAQADYDRRMSAALTVSPSERDQHQGETPSIEDHLRACARFSKYPIEVCQAFEDLADRVAALSTPEAVPVADKQCPVCGGDCADANPPVINCPVRNAQDR